MNVNLYVNEIRTMALFCTGATIFTKVNIYGYITMRLNKMDFYFQNEYNMRLS